MENTTKKLIKCEDGIITSGKGGVIRCVCDWPGAPQTERENAVKAMKGWAVCTFAVKS